MFSCYLMRVLRLTSFLVEFGCAHLVCRQINPARQVQHETLFVMQLKTYTLLAYDCNGQLLHKTTNLTSTQLYEICPKVALYYNDNRVTYFETIPLCPFVENLQALFTNGTGLGSKAPVGCDDLSSCSVNNA